MAFPEDHNQVAPKAPTLDYASPARRDGLCVLRMAIHVAAAVDVSLAAVFALTRPIQLRQPDPYNNLWTSVSTSALLGFVAVWVLMAGATIILLAQGRKPNALSGLWIMGSGIWMIAGLFRMCLFVFPLGH